MNGIAAVATALQPFFVKPQVAPHTTVAVPGQPQHSQPAAPRGTADKEELNEKRTVNTLLWGGLILGAVLLIVLTRK